MERYALLNRDPRFSGLKRTYIQTESLDRNSNEIFGRIFTFNVPNEYNGLTNITIRSTLTTAGDNSSISNYLGSRIFKYLELRTKRGEVIARQYPEYCYARIDQIASTQLGSNYSNMVEPDISFNNTMVHVCTPTFFWISESLDNRLPIRHMEDVELYCEVQDTYAAMGLNADLTDATFECVFDFYEEVNESDALSEKTLSVYDVFREVQLDVVSGDTSQKFLLKCPFPVYMSIFKVNSNDLQSEGEISKLVLNSLGRTWLEKYRRINFDNFGIDNNFTIADGCVFSYKYSNSINRKDTSKIKDLICFNTSMRPTYATITHEDIVANGKATVMHECVVKAHYTVFNDKLKLSMERDGFFDIY